MKRGRGFELLLLLVMWTVLAWRGFPFPNVDDGLFTGAALNLAAGGGLRNPLLESPGPYYLYPPFYDFFLAGWLRVAGVSVASMVGFHLAVCGMSSWLVLEIFRRWNRGAWGWPGVALYVDYVACFGLRSDALGLFFILLSIRLGLASAPVCARVAPFFALLGMATHPPLLALALPWVFWLAVTKPPARIGVGAGVAAVGLLLLVMVGGDLPGFLQGFLKNTAKSRSENMTWMQTKWFHPQNVFKVALLPVFSLVLALRKMKWKGTAIADLAFLLALALGFNAMLGSLTGNRLIGLISVLGILGYLTRATESGRAARTVVWVAAAIFFVSIGRPLAQGLLLQKPSPAEVRALTQKLEQTPHTLVVIDWWSLRYVFDFHPPADAAYISSSRRPQDGYLLLAPGECGLISVDGEESFCLRDPGLPPPDYLRFAGRPVGRWITNDDQIVFLTKLNP